MKALLGKKMSLSIIMLALCASAQAEDPSTDAISNAVITGSSSITAEIQNLIAGYGTKTQQNYLFKATPNIANSQALATGQSQAMSGNLTAPYLMTPDNLPATSNDLISLSQNASPIAIMLKAVNQECAQQPTGSITVGQLQCMPQPITSANSANFDLSSLLNPVGYQDNGASAMAFIKLVSGSYTPYHMLDINSTDFQNKLKDGSTLSQALSYIFVARNYAATQTMGLNTLYQLYQERMPVKNLGQNSGLPATSPNYPDASALQVDEYSAKRRATDNNWYLQMETASPATVQRETLYVLAELRLEAYKTRMALERLNALGAVSSLQQNAITSRSSLQAVEMQLNGNQPGKTVTPPPTPPTSG